MIDKKNPAIWPGFLFGLRGNLKINMKEGLIREMLKQVQHDILEELSNQKKLIPTLHPTQPLQALESLIKL
ncbi:hypothetical protein M2273_005281 [Mucilaginibacter lappiensis]